MTNIDRAPVRVEQGSNAESTRSVTTVGAVTLLAGLGLATLGNPVAVAVGLGVAVSVLGMAASWAAVRYLQ